MEDLELKEIWQSYDKQIAAAQVLNAQSWLLNLRCFENMQQQKAESKLRSLAKFKTAAVVFGILFILLVALLVWGNHFQNPWFVISMGAIGIFSIYAVVVYIRHIILIRRLNYDGNITDTQKKLAVLQSSTFQSTRVMWLQMPFYSTWFWSSKWVFYTSIKFWLIAFPVTLLFMLLAIFLYKNIRIENMHKGWVRSLMMTGPEYKNVVRSMEFLNEIEEFKKELI